MLRPAHKIICCFPRGGFLRTDFSSTWLSQLVSCCASQMQGSFQAPSYPPGSSWPGKFQIWISKTSASHWAQALPSYQLALLGLWYPLIAASLPWLLPCLSPATASSQDSKAAAQQFGGCQCGAAPLPHRDLQMDAVGLLFLVLCSYYTWMHFMCDWCSVMRGKKINLFRYVAVLCFTTLLVSIFVKNANMKYYHSNSKDVFKLQAQSLLAFFAFF